MVHRRSLIWIRTGGLLMLRLSGHWRDVPLLCNCLLLLGWTCADAAVTAVIADTVDCGGVVDHCGVVNVVNIRDIYVVH